MAWISSFKAGDSGAERLVGFGDLRFFAAVDGRVIHSRCAGRSVRGEEEQWAELQQCFADVARHG